MRKNKFFFLALGMGMLALTAAPAFAGYDKSDVMIDQADHSAFGATMFITTAHGDPMPANKWGLAADENPNYGPGTIYVPYANEPYGIVTCPPIMDEATGSPLAASYSHCPTSSTAAQLEEQEATLIISDLFQKVTEGTVAKAANEQGIAQYLDSLFVLNKGVTGNQDFSYVDQTLDQDLADMTAGGGSFGIWQRLHQAVDVAWSGADVVGTPLGAAGDPWIRAIDQTMEAFLSEESGSSSLGLTASGVAPGEVVVYLGTWMQVGELNQTCGSLGIVCNHNEFGGHGTVSASTYNGNSVTGAHDP
ncbi:MAG: hypothetical protein HZA12_06090 [Nitrospirae bacterium]|nr:hypothetical protein [Nitrospirota bacterium]